MESLTLIIGNKNYSSWSLRPWLAMKQAGLAFSEIRIPLYQPESSEKIRQYSPSGKVPVLIHGSITVWDSLAICEYLAECFSDYSWWPDVQYDLAIARSISAEMHSGFFALREQMPMNCRAKALEKRLTPTLQADIDRITALWSSARQQFSSKGDFLCGPFSIADAMYAPVVFRFITYGVNLNALCQEYMETMLALPALQEWLHAAEAESEQISMVETNMLQ